MFSIQLLPLELTTLKISTVRGYKCTPRDELAILVINICM